MKITPVQLAKRIELWGQRLSSLGVAHWTIERVTIADESPSGNERAKASVFVHEYYDSCDFFFRSDELERMDERELDETIIHEWLHVAMRDHDELLLHFETWLPSNTWGDMNALITREREGLVMRLAKTLYEFHAGVKPRFAPKH